MFSFCYLFLHVASINNIVYGSSVNKHNYVMTICMRFHILYSCAPYIHSKLKSTIIETIFRNITLSCMTLSQLVMYNTSFI